MQPDRAAECSCRWPCSRGASSRTVVSRVVSSSSHQHRCTAWTHHDHTGTPLQEGRSPRLIPSARKAMLVPDWRWELLVNKRKLRFCRPVHVGGKNVVQGLWRTTACGMLLLGVGRCAAIVEKSGARSCWQRRCGSIQYSSSIEGARTSSRRILPRTLLVVRLLEVSWS